MKQFLFGLVLICLPATLWAGERAALIRQSVELQILPGFAALSRASGQMAANAALPCGHPDFRYRYFGAFSAWARVSHLRFGPSEEDNLAFGLAYWPDLRGKTPRALRRLLAEGDLAALAPGAFRDQSIAARGFYALDHLLFDAAMKGTGTDEYRCALIETIARDIAATAQELHDRWEAFAPALLAPGPDGPYRSEDEVLRALFNAVSTGLQFSEDLRLGLPLGSHDKPRPKLAEAWRSGLSLTLLVEAVRGSADGALVLAQGDAALMARLNAALTTFEQNAASIHDHDFAGVSTPQGRIRVEALQTDLRRLRRIVIEELGPHLGVAPGFNALDGD